MLPLSEPNALGLVLAHGNFLTSVYIYVLVNMCSSRDSNVLWCHRECRWCHLYNEARCVRVWRWGIHLDKSAGRTPPLRYSGLWRPSGCSGGKPSSRRQPDQVSWRIRYYTRHNFSHLDCLLQKNVRLTKVSFFHLWELERILLIKKNLYVHHYHITFV